MPGTKRRMGKCTGEIGLAASCRAGDHQVVVVGDAGGAFEAQDHRAIKASRGSQVQVLDRRLVAELDGAKARLQPPAVPRVYLLVDQEAEPVLEAEL